MSKEEIRTYIYGYSLGLLVLIACIIVVIGDKKTEKAVFADCISSAEQFTIERDKMPEISKIKISGMPCDNAEQFERWLKEYEQKTGEKGDEHLVRKSRQGYVEKTELIQLDDEVLLLKDTSTAVETESEGDQERPEVQETQINEPVLYRISGECIDSYTQERLYMALDEKGIAYWYETALCQLFQESRGEKYAVSKDGKDHGILQYRLQYWDSVCDQYGYSGASIYDIDVQIEIYTQQTLERINQGLSADEIISRHKTSDYVDYIDWEYVEQVRQWFGQMERVK